MELDEILFSRRVSAGVRLYYIDAKVDSKGQRYMVVSEIPAPFKPGKKKRQRIFIHAEKTAEFARAFAEVAEYIKDAAER